MVFSITAATVPSKPAIPVTSLNGDSTKVVINWALPTDLGGLSIDGYKVEVKTSTTTFAKDLTDCDAESDSLIIQATSCSIPITTLRASPFDLGDGASVEARVVAFNTIGDSA